MLIPNRYYLKGYVHTLAHTQRPSKQTLRQMLSHTATLVWNISITDFVIWWPQRPLLPKVIKKVEAGKDENKWTRERSEGIKESCSCTIWVVRQGKGDLAEWRDTYERDAIVLGWHLKGFSAINHNLIDCEGLEKIQMRPTTTMLQQYVPLELFEGSGNVFRELHASIPGKSRIKHGRLQSVSGELALEVSFQHSSKGGKGIHFVPGRKLCGHDSTCSNYGLRWDGSACVVLWKEWLFHIHDIVHIILYIIGEL